MELAFFRQRNYRRNCGPPIPMACDVWPQTRRVNSFSIGSGNFCEKYKNLFYFFSSIPHSSPHATLTIGIFSTLSVCSLWTRLISVNMRNICCDNDPNAPSGNSSSLPPKSVFSASFSYTINGRAIGWFSEWRVLGISRNHFFKITYSWSQILGFRV